MSDIAVLSKCNVWAVGTLPPQTLTDHPHTLIEHFNGKAWSVKKSPDGGDLENHLLAITATSPSNAWAVGWFHDSTKGYKSLIEHWDGSKWTIQPSPSPGTFYTWFQEVDATSRSNAWALAVAASTSGSETTYKGVAAHWNGHRWRLQDTPKNFGIGGVATLGPKDVWAVGGSLVKHWDGTRWRNLQAPTPPAGFTYALSDVSVRSRTDVWAVGTRYRPTGSIASHKTLIEHWNGVRWRIVKSPNADQGNVLNSVVATSNSNVWAVGFSGWEDDTTAPTSTLVERWNGTAWTIKPSPNFGEGSNSLGSMDASSSSNMWALGSYATTPANDVVLPLVLQCC